jgi:periplasmic protein CpxP/Spy
LKNKLKLTDEQTSKITTMLEDLREEMTTTANEHRDDREAMHTAMQEMMKKTNSQIKSVLTEEQAVKYDEILKERRERMEKRIQKSDKP